MNQYYLNTDLTIISDQDITPLAALLDEKCELLRFVKEEVGVWLVCVEAQGSGHHDDPDSSPERDIDSLLSVLESLERRHRDLLVAGTVDFNIGWQSAEERPEGVFVLSDGLLTRIAALGATLTVTVYPSSENDLGG